jgi:5-(carboxyamino)imidazole ribonucleotide mutase
MSKIAIIIGSESDRPFILEAEEYLTEKNISFTTTVLSAHRNTQATLDFAINLKSKGYKIVIAAAGLSAQLPGLIAANTTLPVIGIPIKANNSTDGLDALLAIAQMPKGTPVATVGINASKNAALLAERILNL